MIIIGDTIHLACEGTVADIHVIFAKAYQTAAVGCTIGSSECAVVDTVVKGYL